LQNVIERCVILSSGTVLARPILGPSKSPQTHDFPEFRTLADVQRDHILQALRATDWVVGGPEGAAARLGVKRTTLLYKMRRLGLSRTED
jgi:formate hydrogenlyase transcriptional activator